MDLSLVNQIFQLNPWLKEPHYPILSVERFIPRVQVSELVDKKNGRSYGLFLLAQEGQGRQLWLGI